MTFDNTSSLSDQLLALSNIADSFITEVTADGSVTGTGTTIAWTGCAPGPLKLALRKNSGLCGPLVGAFHEFCKQPEEVDGWVKFCKESDGGHFWAFERNGDNPSVRLSWEAENITEREDGNLCEFLLQLMVFEFIAGASFKRGRLKMPVQQKEMLLQSTTRLPLSPWHYPAYPAIFVEIHQAYGFIYPVNTDFSYVCFGAETNIAMECLDKLSKWDWIE
jgi:hypothetical protein